MAATAKQQARRVAPLTEQQAHAAALLSEGKPLGDVAAAIGTDVATVARWQTDGPAFIAEVNRRRQEVWRQAQDRLRALVPQALDTLAQAVEAGDLKASVEVLKAAGIYGKASAPRGEVDPELVQVQQAEAWAKAEVAKQGPRDLLCMLRDDEEQRTELAQKRLAELRSGAN